MPAAADALDRRLVPLPSDPVTAAERARVERDIDLLITLLDALDAPSADMEPEEDCCDAGDDDPASSKPTVLKDCFDWEPGDPEDAEPSGDECEPSDADDWMGDRLTTVSGGVPA